MANDNRSRASVPVGNPPATPAAATEVKPPAAAPGSDPPATTPGSDCPAAPPQEVYVRNQRNYTSFGVTLKKIIGPQGPPGERKPKNDPFPPFPDPIPRQ
uniref:Uncharacterized protein n=1 Tax=Zea mays TaxID=4577 RepID=A0A804PWC4_MAIZE